MVGSIEGGRRVERFTAVAAEIISR